MVANNAQRAASFKGVMCVSEHLPCDGGPDGMFLMKGWVAQHQIELIGGLVFKTIGPVCRGGLLAVCLEVDLCALDGHPRGITEVNVRPWVLLFGHDAHDAICAPQIQYVLKTCGDMFQKKPRPHVQFMSTEQI